MKSTEEKIEVMQAFLDGKKIERFNMAGNDGWGEIDTPTWNWFEYDYRIKEEPKTKRVPLCMQDIPAVCWMTNKRIETIYLVTAVGPHGVWFNDLYHEYENLHSYGWQYSSDGENWKPCSKEVTVE